VSLEHRAGEPGIFYCAKLVKTKLLQRPAPDQHPIQGGTRYNRIRCYMHTARRAAIGKITRPYMEETRIGLKTKK